MKTKRELIDRALDRLGQSVKLTPETDEELAYLARMAMSKAKLQSRSKFTCTEFNLPSLEDLQKHIEDAVRRAVDDFVSGAASEHAFVYLRSFSGFDPFYPMNIHIRLPFGREDDPPTWDVDLEQEFRDFAGDRHSSESGFDEGDRSKVEVMRNKLLEIVAYYDEMLGKG